MTATSQRRLIGWIVRLRNIEGHVERLEHFRDSESGHKASWALVLEWRFLYPAYSVEREPEYAEDECPTT